MHLGLLIYDGSKAPLSVRISSAQKRYQQKYGTPANRIYLNPVEQTQDAAQFEASRLAVESANAALLVKHNIMPQYIWLGREETETPAPASALERFTHTDGADYLIDYAHAQLIPVNDLAHPVPWDAFQVENPDEQIAAPEA